MDPHPLLQDAVALHQAGRFDDAAERYAAILADRPTDFNALNLLGILRLAQGRPGEAERLLRQAVTVNPQSVDVHLNLGNAFAATGQLETALTCYTNGLLLAPELPQLHYNRANALKALGRLVEAAGCYGEAARLKPDYAEALYNEANTLMALGRLQPAIERYERLLQQFPNLPSAWVNRGTALHRLGRDEEAVTSYRQALHFAPQSLEALNNLGNVLALLKRFDAAIQTLRQAQTLSPASLETLLNLAAALRGAGQSEDSAASCRSALALDPNSADAEYNLGLALFDLRQVEDALSCFSRVAARAPRHQDALSLALGLADLSCDWAKLPVLEAAVERHSRAGDLAIGAFYALNRNLEPEAQLQTARNDLARRGLHGRAAGFRYAAPADKLRLAYVSGDFRTHPMAQLIAEMLQQHDRSTVEVNAISYGPDDGSEERHAIQRSVDRFVDVLGMSDAEAARQIHALGIDIAIDLAGHTRDNRMGILASRPAPVQVSYLGFAGSSGADFIDYILADRFVLPMDQQRWYSERIVHLPECYFVNHNRRESPDAMPSRQACGLPETGFVFCSLNHTYKIKPQIFAIWLRLLGQVPGSVLWLLRDNAAAERNLKREAAAGGIDPDRVIFAPRVSQTEHLARQAQADLFLDTAPVNAHTTAAEALWAGLPLITCPGRTLIGRTAGSMLMAVGMPELIAADLAGYEALALGLARDPARLAALRSTILAARTGSPLFDAARFARHFEAAYRVMAERWREGQAPTGFAVTARS
jgi:protein O-GlcNAc transferase